MWLSATNQRIEDPRKIAAIFAMAVTAETRMGEGYLEKHGDASLFRAFQRVMPQVNIRLDARHSGEIFESRPA
jgi:hypothetical protein